MLDNQQERLWLQQQEKGMLSDYQGITQAMKLGDVYLSKTAEIMDSPYGAVYIRMQDNGHDFLTRACLKN
jgi:two-component system chemotaxis sensor kinase CheA